MGIFGRHGRRRQCGWEGRTTWKGEEHTTELEKHFGFDIVSTCRHTRVAAKGPAERVESRCAFNRRDVFHCCGFHGG